MTAWEYKTLNLIGNSTADQMARMTKLNNLGADGWEVITMDHGTLLLKREKH